MAIQRILRGKETDERTGLSRSQRYAMERDGKFPKRRKLSKRASGYLESEITDWILNRPIAD
jgi:prophage regulatory protein